MNALVPIRDEAKSLVDDIAGDLQTALPATIPFERFKATFVTAVAHNKDILSCDPQSVKTALMKAAIDNLMPDNREAAIVPFNTKTKDDKGRDKWVKLAQYMPMVQGIRKRALELGGVRTIIAECVYENDHFDAVLGDDPHIEHKQVSLGKPRGEILGAYAIFKDEHGNILHREVMSKEDIEASRKVSKAKDGPGWTSFYSEFARKTVVRRGAKSVPNLPEKLRAVIERDDDYVEFEQVGSAKTLDHNPLVEETRQIESREQVPMERVDAETGEVVEPRAGQSEDESSVAELESKTQERSGEPVKADNGPSKAQSEQNSSASSNESADEGGESGAAAPARLPADLFKRYHSALARMNSAENVEKAHKAFWTKEGVEAKGGDLKLAKDIHQAHLDRAGGKLEAEYVAKNVEEWVSALEGDA